MLFNSLAFLFGFLPWALIGFWLLNPHQNARLWFLCAVSFIFYGYWDWRFVPLLAGSILVNWLIAQLWFQMRIREIPIAGIGLNLLLLAIYKYLGFFAEIAHQAIGWQGDFVKLALPLGISFFTFHHIIYLADLLKTRAPRYNLRDYALYIALFPQILAGPIVRYSEIMPQFALPPLRPGFASRLGRGVSLLLIGLSKKVFLADMLAKLADPVFTDAAQHAVSRGQAWTAIFAFPLQIYFDFSGYSDMAIGIALMLGFELPINFDVPYRAANLSFFWRRWHMTLMRFLRDYVYVPLGGNRVGLARQCVNVCLTFLLGGLWHGAGWTFLIWGALHGLGLSAGILWRRVFKPMPLIFSWPLLIVFLLFTWIFFRSPSLSAAGEILYALLKQGGGEQGETEPLKNFVPLLIAGGIACIGPSSQKWVQDLKPRAYLAPIAAATMIVLLFKINGSQAYEFIYFHF